MLEQAWKAVQEKVVGLREKHETSARDVERLNRRKALMATVRNTY